MKQTIRRIIGALTPPVFHGIYRALSSSTGFFGDYKSWDLALKVSGGYDSDVILNKVKDALLKVKNGEAIYERDSVLFDKVEYSWPLLAGLLWVAGQNGNRLNIVDFGGSLGSSYFQNRNMLSHLHELKWNIVEQKKFVECGKRFFEDEHLKFYYTLGDCLKEQAASTILLSSVIQYLEKPYDLLEDVKRRKFQYIIIDRTAFLDVGDDRITVQRVPTEIYQASYPAWFLNRDKFLAFLANRYDVVADFESNDRADIPSVFKGYIFRLKNVERRG
jgi:putative methyltransferase (TIGR04325 family)